MDFFVFERTVSSVSGSVGPVYSCFSATFCDCSLADMDPRECFQLYDRNKTRDLIYNPRKEILPTI